MRHRGQIWRRCNLLVEDLPVEVLLALGSERRTPGQHLVVESSQSPPVHRLAVAAANEHLRSHVLAGSAEGSVVLAVPGLFGEAEVGDGDVSR